MLLEFICGLIWLLCTVAIYGDIKKVKGSVLGKLESAFVLAFGLAFSVYLLLSLFSHGGGGILILADFGLSQLGYEVDLVVLSE